MNLQWFLAAAGVIVGIAAVLWARHVTKRLERLSQSYWELRYEQGQLAARVGRLEPEGEAGTDSGSKVPQQGKQQASFVPLSSLKGRPDL